MCEIDFKTTVDNHILNYFEAKYSIYYAKYLKIDGFYFYPDGFLVLDLNIDINTKSIGRIIKIIVCDKSYFFYVQLYNVDQKCSHKNSLEVSSTKGLHL